MSKFPISGRSLAEDRPTMIIYGQMKLKPQCPGVPERGAPAGEGEGRPCEMRKADSFYYYYCEGRLRRKRLQRCGERGRFFSLWKHNSSSSATCSSIPYDCSVCTTCRGNRTEVIPAPSSWTGAGSRLGKSSSYALGRRLSTAIIVVYAVHKFVRRGHQ
jgi:hypothetical protein